MLGGNGVSKLRLGSNECCLSVPLKLSVVLMAQMHMYGTLEQNQ